MLGKTLAVSASLFWAIAVMLFKRAGDTMPPLALNWYKTAVTSLLLLPFLLLGDYSTFSGNDIWKVFLSGILGITLSDTLFFIALDRLGASLTAIVDCFYAPFVMLATWAMLGQQPRLAQFVGMIVIMAALAVVSFEKDAPRTHLTPKRLWTGILAGTGAMATVGVSIPLMQPVLTHHSTWVVTTLRTVAALLGLTFVLLFKKDRPQQLAALANRKAWRHALPGALIGSGVAMSLWVAAFKFTNTNDAAILNQTSTFFIITLAVWWLKEPFTLRRLIGTLLAVSGAVTVIVGGR